MDSHEAATDITPTASHTSVHVTGSTCSTNMHLCTTAKPGQKGGSCAIGIFVFMFSQDPEGGHLAHCQCWLTKQSPIDLIPRLSLALLIYSLIVSHAVRSAATCVSIPQIQCNMFGELGNITCIIYAKFVTTRFCSRNGEILWKLLSTKEGVLQKKAGIPCGVVRYNLHVKAGT